MTLVIRLLVMIALGLAGWGVWLFGFDDPSGWSNYLPWGLISTLAGGGIGGLMVFLPGTLIRTVQHFNQVPSSALVSSTVGLVAGLIIASLISIPLINLNGWPSWGIPLILNFVLGSMGFWMGARREGEVRRIIPHEGTRSPSGRSYNGRILVDTSAIIDGRIADLSQTGFVQGPLIITGFVLDELRHIADSSDGLRRSRGRRGLDVLSKLQKDASVAVQVIDVDDVDDPEVDGKLVKLAKRLKAPILTTDFNLNRVAEVQGVQVLNVNELANALKPMVLPGEELAVNIIQEGKEIGQGVAFLDDGTMVVVEGGRRYLNSLQSVTVTRVLQTAAGRIVFAQSKGG